MNRLSDNLKMALGLKTTDIGGTNGSSTAVVMTDGDTIAFIVRWDGTDVLDTCKLQICDSNGANGHDLGIGISAADLVLGSTAATYVLEASSADLTKYNQANAGTQTYIKCYCAETGNAGADELTIFSVKANLRKKYDNVCGADYRDTRT